MQAFEFLMNVAGDDQEGHQCSVATKEMRKLTLTCFFLSLQVTRDYDEEEQGYDSEKEREEKKDSDDSGMSPNSVEGNGTGPPAKEAKVNGDDHHEEDMDVSE